MSCKMLLNLLLLSILLGGCANTYSLVRQTKEDVPRLSFADTFCIAVGSNRTTIGTNYDQIRSSMSDVILSSLEEEGIVPTSTDLPLRFYDALIAARSSDCDYIIYTTIVRWENHSGKWTGIPNTAEVTISLIDTTNGKYIDTVMISAASRQLFSGDDPHDLLLAPVTSYISGLFRHNTVKPQ